MPFSVSERRRAGPVVVLELKGRLTLGHGNEILDRELQERIAAGEDKLLLDCAGVEAIDSQGLKALARALITLQRRQGKLKLVHLQPRVREVLQITRLLDVLEAFEDEEAAVASF